MLAACGMAAAADAPKALPLDQAITVAQAAIARMQGQWLQRDRDGHGSGLHDSRLVLRSDAAAARTVEIARRKAYTVIKMRMSSGEFGKSVPAPKTPAAPPTLGAMPPGVNGDDNLITLPAASRSS